MERGLRLHYSQHGAYIDVIVNRWTVEQIPACEVSRIIPIRGAVWDSLDRLKVPAPDYPIVGPILRSMIKSLQ